MQYSFLYHLCHMTIRSVEEDPQIRPMVQIINKCRFSYLSNSIMLHYTFLCNNNNNYHNNIIKIIESSIVDLCKDLERATDRLRMLNAYDALVLYRAGFSAPTIFKWIQEILPVRIGGLKICLTVHLHCPSSCFHCKHACSSVQNSTTRVSIRSSCSRYHHTMDRDNFTHSLPAPNDILAKKRLRCTSHCCR